MPVFPGFLEIIRVVILIIACFIVIVYPTCSAGQAKTVANLEVFIAVNDVLLMERNSTVHWMVNN